MPRNQDLKNKAYEILKERLIHCVYEPGSFLNEMQLAADLGFSRTPIREAISRLEYDQLVQVVPKKGIYVSNITLTDVHQIFQTRLEIEPIALSLSASKLPMEELLHFREQFSREPEDISDAFLLDTAMHLFLIEYCGNRYLINMMRKLFEDNTRVIIASKQNQVKIHDARHEHLNIINALIESEVDKALQLLKEHIVGCQRAALDYFFHLGAGSLTASSTSYKPLLERFNAGLTGVAGVADSSGKTH